MTGAASRWAAPVAIGVGFGLVAALAASPMLAPGTALAASARFVFAGLCHQQEARSFALDGHTMAVCHRCVGIYVGLSAGALLAPLLPLDPTRLRIWALGVTPLAVQVGLAWIWPSLDLYWLRTLTGLIAGAVGALLFARVFVDARGRATRARAPAGRPR